MKILGVKISNLDEKQALKKVREFLESGRQHYIVTPNPEFLVKAQEDKDFKNILNRADLSIADGFGLVLASRLSGRSFKRMSGVDLMEKICQRSSRKGWPVFLLGGRGETAKKAAKNLRNKYPGLEIYSSEEESPALDISQPAVLFVAFGAPRQEKWIVENLEKIPSVKLAMGVGGAFDFVSGRVMRSPEFLRNIGLEWLWRLFRQPWRAKRTFKAIVVFPYLVLKSRLSTEK